MWLFRVFLHADGINLRRLTEETDCRRPITISLFHGEVRHRLGMVPNFFLLAPNNPDIAQNLWGFARFGYLDNPLPSLFKARLFVCLSRFCERYCIVRHVRPKIWSPPHKLARYRREIIARSALGRCLQNARMTKQELRH
jgi:hypothetical protein